MACEQSVAVMRKELSSYFTTPVAYLVMVLFLVLTGWFFFSDFFLIGRADLRGFFELLPLVFALIIPAVTMRLLAEERHSGSLELLLTLPVSVFDVVLGKFLAALVFVIAMLLPTSSYVLSVSSLGELDPGPVLGGYLGAILLGAAFCSVGVFSSALTKNQVIAFIVGMAVCFGLTAIDRVLPFVPSSAVGAVEYLSASFHFRNISRGVLDSRDLLYFLSVTALAMLGSVRVLEGRG